jgi:DNA-binding SARP family transcriptional activator/tetratricopeptide (TPR) repeat protein
MRWGILGPLQVADDAGTEIRLPAGRLRVLLAGLLTQANHAVPVDELVELVWDGAPPVRAARTVRVHVVRLRRALGPSAAARIVTQPPGYLCRAEEDELDVLRFEKLCRQARSAAREPAWPRAAALLTEALGLWRGAPLADVPSDLLRQRELPRLDRLRVQAIDDHVDAEMHLDRHEQLVPQLHDLIARYPLRERPPAQLMRVLARAGRRAEALEVYQDARRVLASELGIEPGPELRGLHERILAGDAEPAPPADAVPACTAVATPAPGQLATTLDAPALATPAPSEPARVVPRELPMGVRDFTGRSGELRALTRLLDEFGDRVPGAPLISAIGGTAGVGKTALALHWAHQAAGRFPDGQLYVNLRGFDPSGEAVPPGEAVRGFLDALGIPAEGIPVSLQAQAGLYRSLLAGKRVLVLLDNARDAEQLRPLLPGSPGCLVLVTSRSQLTALVASEHAYLLSLDVFSVPEASELLARRLRAGQITAEPAVVSELAGLCAGLPLALSIVAARATARPGWPLEAVAAELGDGRGRLDTLDAGDAATAVRAVFSWSYQQLSEPAARMFRLLGIHPGPDVSLPAAASLTGFAMPHARAAIAELAGAHLVSEQPPGRFSFHDLLRAYAAEQCQACDTEAEQHAATGRVLDHYLHTGRAAAELYPCTFTLALPALAPPAAPGVAPEELHSRSQALAWFQAEHKVLIAATARAADGFDAHAMQIPLALRPFLNRTGHWHDCATTGLTALIAARRLSDTAGQGHAHCHLGITYANLGSYTEAETHLREALALYGEIDDPRGQGVAHTGLETLFHRRQRPADALRHAEQALDQFKTAGYRQGEEATALNNVGWSHLLLGDTQQAIPLLEQAIDLHRTVGDSIGLAATWDSLGYARYLLGNHEQAITCYQRAETLSRELADLPLEATILTHRGEAHQAAADPGAAREAWQQALDILTDLNHHDADDLRDKLVNLSWLRG